MFQGSFKNVSRVFQVGLKGISSTSKGISRVFERRLKCVSGKFKKKFQGSFKSV